MKKLLILIGLFLTLSLSGQLLPGVVASQGGAASYAARSAEYDTVYQAMATKPSAINAKYQDDLVYSLDSAGYWDRTDYLLMFAVEHENATLINWISPGNNDADNVSSTAWTQYEGYLGAAGDYISTNWNPTTNGANYTRYSASGGVYVRNNIQSDIAVYGAAQGTLRFSFYPRTTADLTLARINTTADLSGATYGTDSRGMWINTRRADDDIETYKNGTGRDTETDATTGLVDAELYVFRHTALAEYSAYQVSILFVMDGLTDADAEKVSIIYNRYMTRIGKNVYNNP